MKSIYLIGAATVVVSGMSLWGMSEYLSLRSQLAETQPDPQAQTPPAQPVVSPVQSTKPDPQSSPPPSVQVSFDQLPLCEQLDGIYKGSKSVSQFIVNSGRYDQFAAEIAAHCNWHAEQLKQANSILHPPVARLANQPSTHSQSSVDKPVASSSTTAAPARKPWNNCNGILEPGESYSAECESRQKQSNQTGIPVSGDNRPIALQGDKPHNCCAYEGVDTADNADSQLHSFRNRLHNSGAYEHP
jgi:hypothetical protein